MGQARQRSVEVQFERYLGGDTAAVELASRYPDLAPEYTDDSSKSGFTGRLILLARTVHHKGRLHQGEQRDDKGRVVPDGGAPTQHEVIERQFVNAGDYIITDPDGARWVCSPAQFAAMYDVM